KTTFEISIGIKDNSKRREQANETWAEKKRTDVIDLEGSTSKGKNQDQLTEDSEKQADIDLDPDDNVQRENSITDTEAAKKDAPVVNKDLEAGLVVEVENMVETTDAHVTEAVKNNEKTVITSDADEINKTSDIVNNEDDDASSHASEFVDATEIIDQDDSLSDNEIPTPERVQKDMQFLHESWANLAEKEDEENRVITAQIQQETNVRMDAAHVTDTSSSQLDEQGFQMVVRGKKKTQKHQSQGSRLYATRSKVGSSKNSQ
ncbi:hypothetical protein A2U01_0016592, partial [Trifolium medium]|nr:hypothetical protein [Trifolium medium]